MTTILLFLLALSCAGILILGFKNPKRMLQYPFLAAAVFTGWVLPQLVGLSNNHRIPATALNKTIFVTLLCVLAIYYGNKLGGQSFKAWNWRLSRRRLLIVSAIFSIFGAYFFYRVGLLQEAVTAELGAQWSGPITIYYFLATVLTYGLVLALLAFSLKPNRWAMLVIIFDLVFYLERIVVQGRRQAAAELFIILGLILWFHFRKLPPRWIVAVVLIVGTLWVNSVGLYRETMMDPRVGGIKEILSIDYVQNFKTIFSKGGYELTNAVYNIEGVDRLGRFDFGLSHWNGFVHMYVPGQIFGYDFKHGMMIDLGNLAHDVFYYVANVGTTHTGMTDAFASFWYFGAIKFFIISYIIAKLWKAANTGHQIAQILIMLVLVGALESITHSTDRFFMVWPKIVVFLLPALWYAKVRTCYNFSRFPIYR